MSAYREMQEHVINGKKKPVAELTQTLLERGKAAEEILHQGLLPGMTVVGQKFQRGEYFLAEMLMAARALNAGLDILKPILEASDVKPLAKVLIGTVKGDIHDIGKNLVSIMLRGSGFEVIDAGVDVSPAKFVELYRENQPDLIGLSALLTTTMPGMEEVVAAFEEQGLRKKVKFMIGGAPVSEAFAEKVGADGYAQNAPAAVELARSLLGVSS